MRKKLKVSERKISGKITAVIFWNQSAITMDKSDKEEGACSALNQEGYLYLF